MKDLQLQHSYDIESIDAEKFGELLWLKIYVTNGSGVFLWLNKERAKEVADSIGRYLNEDH